MKSFVVIVSAITLALVCLTGTAWADLVTNGDFATYDLTGWTQVGGNDYVKVEDWGVSHDPILAMTNPGGGVSVRQVIDTISAGQRYTVSFDAAGYSTGDSGQVDVYLLYDDGAGNLTDVAGKSAVVDSTATFNSYGFYWDSQAGQPYIGKDLVIQAGTSSYIWTATDNIVVTSAPIPEPSALALLAISLISLLCYAWRKRK